MSKQNDYPGRMIADEDRTPFDLGWEYARRGWGAERCNFRGDKLREFLEGMRKFTCSDPAVDEAMLRGIDGRK